MQEKTTIIDTPTTKEIIKKIPRFYSSFWYDNRVQKEDKIILIPLFTVLILFAIVLFVFLDLLQFAFFLLFKVFYR